MRQDPKYWRLDYDFVRVLPMSQGRRSSPALLVIFITVAIDLVGFGIVIPLISLYGRNTGASAFELAVLGGIYSFCQFFFSPIWGRMSDRRGRRPILLLSLLGSTASYALFSVAQSIQLLILSRALGGIFAANISTAQAYVADVTKPEDRAKGMGMIGAAFGLGFTIGPPIGGIVAHHWGLWAPGALAAMICGANLILAWFRLPESLSVERRGLARQRAGSAIQNVISVSRSPISALLLTFFCVTFAFSVMEQVFSLLFQVKFSLNTSEAGYRTGWILMASGLLGIFIQGGLIRKLAPRFGELKLLRAGLVFNVLGMAIFPFGGSFGDYFLLVIPIALGSSLVNPAVTALISRSTDASSQGEVFGQTQGLGSLARALGPFAGLLLFSYSSALPFWVSSAVSVALFIYWMSSRRGVALPVQLSKS